MLPMIIVENPESRESILGLQFRYPAPSSQPPYAVPKQSDADPKLFHYYPRDRRRNVKAPVVVENPAVVKVLAAAGETSGAELVDVAKVRPPKLAEYTFQIAPNQPKHDGYFPITNYQ